MKSVKFFALFLSLSLLLAGCAAEETAATASPTACTQGADDLERERGGEGRRERERTENHSIRAPPTTCTR